jgi:protease-4
VSLRRGVTVVLILITLAVCASFVMLLLVVASGAAPPAISANSTLYLTLDMPLSEIEPSSVLSQFVKTQPSLRSTIDLLRKAKLDPHISGIVVTPVTSGALWGQLQEVRGAILDFRKSGKPATAFLESGGAQEYYVASACDRVLMMPAGSLDLSGVASYELFFRGALDKIGVIPDLLHIGEYKTAANTFTQKGMTAAHKEMTASLNHDAFEELVRAIAEGRKRSQADVRQMIDNGPYLAEEAHRVGLVDDLAYQDQIGDRPPVQHTGHVDSADYLRVPMSSVGLGSGPKIAVLYAVGTIASGRSSFDSPSGNVLGSETFNEWIRKVRTDDSIRAIVVRIDSPGGSAIASDVIWRELMLARDVKPLVVSMGDVAASGGYYIAVPAQVIVAQPGTLTGSIGVVTGKYVVGEMLDKLGVGTATVSEGTMAEIDSPFRAYTPAERARVEAQMRATYDLFVSKVAASRGVTPDRIDAVGQGRVWTGRQARERGLVDAIGGLQDAIVIAKARAKLDPTKDVEIVTYPQKRGFYDFLSNPFGSSTDMSLDLLAGAPASRTIAALSSRLRLFRSGEPLVLMPNIFWNGR